MIKLSDDELLKLKKIEYEMLVAFDSVCKKLELSYYLIGGTLLGAVRHQGFIPWDDDIDIGMPRADYEIFISKGQEYMPKHLFIQNIYTDTEYPLIYTKIRNSNTTFIETPTKKLNINHGVFIDLFPLDYYPENKYKILLLKLKKKLMSISVLRVLNLPEKATLSLKAKLMLSTLIYPSTKKALIKKDKLYKSAKKTNLYINHDGAWGEREIAKTQWFDETIMVRFEQGEFPAPKQYDEYLTKVYGDYMTPPPVEKRVAHHYVEAIDLDKPYTYYINEKD